MPIRPAPTNPVRGSSFVLHGKHWRNVSNLNGSGFNFVPHVRRHMTSGAHTRRCPARRARNGLGSLRRRVPPQKRIQTGGVSRHAPLSRAAAAHCGPSTFESMLFGNRPQFCMGWCQSPTPRPTSPMHCSNWHHNESRQPRETPAADSGLRGHLAVPRVHRPAARLPVACLHLRSMSIHPSPSYSTRPAIHSINQS